MRVLFDGVALCEVDGGPGAGIEHYSSALLRALAEVSPHDQFLVALPPKQTGRSFRKEFAHLKNIAWMSAWLPRVSFASRHLFLPARAALARADLFFSPIGQLPFGWRRLPSVITVHDVSIYDHPEWFPEEVVTSFSTRRVVPVSFEHASKIVCVSKWTQSRLHERFPSTKHKTDVVYEGVDLGKQKEIEHADRFPFDRDSLLCLGTIEPRKNLSHAFFAFHEFLKIHPELANSVRLIVAGKYGWKTEETIETAKQVNEKWKGIEPEGVIQFLGPVTEEEKWYLLSRASALLFPSHEEGFGLPILEAMSVGTPVIATKGGAIEEVAGDSAMLIDSDDVEAMTLAIAQCLLVPEGVQSLREDGYRRAKQFLWKKTAQRMSEVFSRVLFANKRSEQSAP